MTDSIKDESQSTKSPPSCWKESTAYSLYILLEVVSILFYKKLDINVILCYLLAIHDFAKENGWVVYTTDGMPSAQWEIQVLVTEDGYEVLAY